jgi:hypothetical protein
MHKIDVVCVIWGTINNLNVDQELKSYGFWKHYDGNHRLLLANKICCSSKMLYIKLGAPLYNQFDNAPMDQLCEHLSIFASLDLLEEKMNVRLSAFSIILICG